MGIPAMSSGGPRVGVSGSVLPHLAELNNLDCFDAQMLLGNGFHYAVQGAWMMYCLSNTIMKVDWNAKIMTEPSIFFDENHDNDYDDAFVAPRRNGATVTQAGEGQT
eukprot:4643698-Pyramimonas_sp.AAC.1